MYFNPFLVIILLTCSILFFSKEDFAEQNFVLKNEHNLPLSLQNKPATNIVAILLQYNHGIKPSEL